MNDMPQGVSSRESDGLVLVPLLAALAFGSGGLAAGAVPMAPVFRVLVLLPVAVLVCALVLPGESVTAELWLYAGLLVGMLHLAQTGFGRRMRSCP